MPVGIDRVTSCSARTPFEYVLLSLCTLSSMLHSWASEPINRSTLYRQWIRLSARVIGLWPYGERWLWLRGVRRLDAALSSFLSTDSKRDFVINCCNPTEGASPH